MSYNDDRSGYLAFVILCAILIAFALVVGVTDEPTAARILESEGVSEVEFTGYDWFSCGGGDWFHTGFAGARNGKRVSGVVCSGFLKAATVRYH